MQLREPFDQLPQRAVGAPKPASSACAIVLCCDDAYAFYSQVTLFSLLINTNARNFEAVVFTTGLSQAAIERFDRLGKRCACALNILTIPEERAPKFKAFQHISAVSNFRYIAPDVLDIDVILYLDSDVLVQSDIRDVFVEHRSGATISAVVDEPYTSHNKIGVFNQAGLPLSEPYVNAGVMVLNCVTWRKDGVTKALTDFQNKYEQLSYNDQDCLNIVLRGRKNILSPKWNVLSVRDEEEGPWDLGRRFNADTFDGILHFVTDIKPWTTWADPWSSDLYLRYAYPLKLPADFWKTPQRTRHSMYEARAAELRGDFKKANEIRKKHATDFARVQRKYRRWF
jgi:lipopolysaccharide biosynthesis glycosyltransferase